MIAGTRYRLTQQVSLQQKLSREIARAQTDISTQKRIQAPSDDPSASARIADIQRGQSNETAWAANTDAAIALSDRVDANLTTLATNVDRAKTLMLAASNATLSDGDRASIATELRGIAEDVAALSRERDSRGQPLYAATAALAYPVGAALSVQAGAVRAKIFDGIATAAGPKDLAAILTDAADAIVLADPAEREAATTISLAEIDAAADSIADAHGEQGVRATRLESIRERFADTRLVNAAERSGLEDTDIEATAVSLQAKLTALLAAQAVLAKTSQRSLFDLI